MKSLIDQVNNGTYPNGMPTLINTERRLIIYGITYGDKTTEHIEFRNDNPVKPWRWENGPMIHISDNMLEDVEANDVVGVLSWKFKMKTGIGVQQIIDAVESEYADVYNFSAPLGNKHFMNWSEEGHIGIKDFIRRCCQHCGLEYTNDPEHVIYANQFLARKAFYQDYINRVIKPSLALLEGPMWNEVNKDAGYTRAMRADKLKTLTGLDFYNYVPFILERMISQYVHNFKLKVKDCI